MFAVISISFAGREKDVLDLNFENNDRMTVTDDRGKFGENFRIYYTRLKWDLLRAPEKIMLPFRASIKSS